MRSRRLHTRPLHPLFGAEVLGGVDVRKLDDASFAEIARAIEEYSVVLIARQKLDDDVNTSINFCFSRLLSHRSILPEKYSEGANIWITPIGLIRGHRINNLRCLAR